MGVDFYRRIVCRTCGSDRLAVLIDFGDMPLAGGFLMPEHFGEEKFYPLDVSVCLDCSLVQGLNVINPNLLFRHYFYLSSVTGTLSRHFNNLAMLLRREILPWDGGFVVEIGCNDGVLLKPLQQMGVRVLGVDPARNIAKIARGKDIEVISEYFTEEIAGRIIVEKGPADVITASNVFAHIDDLDEVMRGVSTLLAENGTFIVETRYIVDMLERMQFDTIYHEHLSYYSVHSLSRFFQRHGFKIVRVDRIPMHGGAIRVFAQRENHGTPDLTEILSLEECLEVNKPYTYIKFGDGVAEYRRNLRQMLSERKARGRTLCGYGAAGRATILLNYCGVGDFSMQYIVDESPLRAGKYMPGIHIPIYFPSHFREHPTDDCMITAWTYEREIIDKEPDYRGTFIIPLPEIRERKSDE
jgi:novobiocin biosynthesis protein NovU/D-mycarose 3-C-methyltransferase